MSVSEWSLPLSRGGVKTLVGEYSISAVGPGPRAIREWGLAKAAGLGGVAKGQVNNSWELSAVADVPGMDPVAGDCARLGASGSYGGIVGVSLRGSTLPYLA